MKIRKMFEMIKRISRNLSEAYKKERDSLTGAPEQLAKEVEKSSKKKDVKDWVSKG